jgi:hypothetical protein
MVSSIRIPPESTGPRISTEERYILEFDNQTINFSIGDIVTGALSNANGTVTSIVTEGFASNSGRLYLKDINGAFQNDEDIQVSAITHASVDTTNEAFVGYRYQKMIVTDPDNPTRQQKIDQFGATLSSFPDGSPSLGPFGTLTVGEPQVVKEYRFAYGLESEKFWDQTATGGTITYEANAGVSLLSTTTTSGSSASRTSHFYHPYVPGIGSAIEMTLQLGDSGKTNLVREWGYGDDDNGLFFRLNDTTLQLVLRSNATGSIVEIVIDQGSWNADKANGTGRTGFTLDVTKANIYYLDFQWLGAGRVKFGVVESDGTKLLLHTLENANINNLPYMRTATLPIRVKQENTGTTGSSSELRFACAVVKHSSKVDINGDRRTDSLGSIETVQDSQGEWPVVAYRMSNTINSITNRALARIKSLSSICTNTSDVPALFKIYLTDSTNLSNAVFSAVSGTILEKDTSANSFSNAQLAIPIMSNILVPGESNIVQHLTNPNVHDVELYLDADGTSQKCFVCTVEALGSGNVEISMVANWEEIKL